MPVRKMHLLNVDQDKKMILKKGSEFATIRKHRNGKNHQNSCRIPSNCPGVNRSQLSWFRRLPDYQIGN